MRREEVLWCPRCGRIAASGFVSDGDPLLCGCVGLVSVDSEEPPYVMIMSDNCCCGEALEEEQLYDPERHASRSAARANFAHYAQPGESDGPDRAE